MKRLAAGASLERREKERIERESVSESGRRRRRRRHRRQRFSFLFFHAPGRHDGSASAHHFLVSCCYLHALSWEGERERREKKKERQAKASAAALFSKEQASKKKIVSFISVFLSSYFSLSLVFLSQGTTLKKEKSPPPPSSPLCAALFHLLTMSRSAVPRSPFSNLKPASRARFGRTRCPSRTTLAPSPRSVCVFFVFVFVC